MNNITINPFNISPLQPTLNSNNLDNNEINNISLLTTHNSLHNMILEKFNTIFNLFSTGNSNIDNIIKNILHSIIFGSVITLTTNFIMKFGDSDLIIRYIKILFMQIIKLIKNIYYFIKTTIFRQREIKTINKQVDIPYISDTKQINELYKAVYWYLTNKTNNVDYIKEPYLQFVYDKKINQGTNLNNLSINKILTQNKSKEIVFKNQKITYYLSTDLITVYTDKDRKRENYKITLTTNITELAQTDILEEFCHHCCSEYKDSLTTHIWSQLIYTNKNGSWSSAPSNNSRKLETIILKNNLKDTIKTDLQLFLNSKEWYNERDIPYTRGYLFYGLPGTGKTSMIKAMSLYSKRHIHYLMLNDVKNDAELFELFKNIDYKSTILVIEDIDAMIDIVKSRDNNDENNNDSKETRDKSNINDIITVIDKLDKFKNGHLNTNHTNNSVDNKVTLSGLLNAIDGVFGCDGRILIMTTNHPEILDEALIRPGRIDAKYQFDNCSRNQVKDLYEMFFNKLVNLEDLENIQASSYSPAHITSVFLRYRNHPEMALKHLDDVENKIVIKPLIDDNKIINQVNNIINNKDDKQQLFTITEISMPTPQEIMNSNILSLNPEIKINLK
jgi:AAA+ superfamily predicted ATPase